MQPSGSLDVRASRGTARRIHSGFLSLGSDRVDCFPAGGRKLGEAIEGRITEYIKPADASDYTLARAFVLDLPKRAGDTGCQPWPPGFGADLTHLHRRSCFAPAFESALLARTHGPSRWRA